MAEIDVAVFTFDEDQELKFVNRAGARLLSQRAERLLGRRADEIGLQDCLAGEAPRVINTAFPGGVGRWEIRRSSFRQGGLPHELLVLSDLSQPLREEERQAWQRLIRVIGHEMNNSLAPIKSIAGSLSTIVEREPPPSDWREDVQRGLGVIGSRAESLSRFMSAYARLAKLPPPKFAALDVARGHRSRRRPGEGAQHSECRRPAADHPGRQRSARAGADQSAFATPSTRCGRPAAACRSAGSAFRDRLRRPWSCGSRTKGRACRIPATSSCRSSPPSLAAPGSASCSADRSPRPTAAA